MSDLWWRLLTEFLLARIAEDEAVARNALDGRRVELWSAPFLRAGVEETRFLARFGPVRILAKCEADRRIVERCRRTLDDFGDGAVDRRHKHDAQEILAALALPFANHPDYRAEWAV